MSRDEPARMMAIAFPAEIGRIGEGRLFPKVREDTRSPGRYRDYPRVGLRDSVMDCG